MLLRLIAYLLVLFVAPNVGFVVGWILSFPFRPLAAVHDAAPELIENIIEGAAATLASIATFKFLGLTPGLDIVVFLLAAFLFNDRRRQKRADGMVAAHWVLAQKPDFEAAKAIVGQSPIDAAGWIKLQKWERVRAWGHGIGIVVAGIGALVQSVPPI